MTEKELKEHEVMFATYSAVHPLRGLALVAEVRRCWAEIKKLEKSQGASPQPHEDAVWRISDQTPEV